MTVQPVASRVTVTERRAPSTMVELVDELDPPPSDDDLDPPPSDDDLDETEELDEPEPVARDEVDIPTPSSATVLSTTRPSVR